MPLTSSVWTRGKRNQTWRETKKEKTLFIDKKVNSIRTPMLTQGRFERTENNLMHFKWEVTWTHANQSNTF